MHKHVDLSLVCAAEGRIGLPGLPHWSPWSSVLVNKAVPALVPLWIVSLNACIYVHWFCSMKSSHDPMRKDAVAMCAANASSHSSEQHPEADSGAVNDMMIPTISSISTNATKVPNKPAAWAYDVLAAACALCIGLGFYRMSAQRTHRHRMKDTLLRITYQR